MSFANHNILDIALSLIPPTIVQIRKNLGTQVNKYGQMEANYGEWIEVYGIVQPGSEQNEHVEGIDLSKKHVTIWLRGVALDGTHVQWAPDQIRYVGKIFNVTGIKDWFPYDNYRECECVEVMNLDESQRSKISMIAQKAIEVASVSNEGGGKSKEQSVMSLHSSTERQKDVQKKDIPAIFRSDSDRKEDMVETKKPSVVGKALIRF